LFCVYSVSFFVLVCFYAVLGFELKADTLTT
jgi:hypothetical protein